MDAPKTHDPSPQPSPGDAPVEDSRHLKAILFTLRKAHAELVGHAAASSRAAQVHTQAQALAYAQEVLPKLHAERQRRREARKHHKA